MKSGKEKLKLPKGFTVTAHSGSEGTADNSMEFLEKCVEIGVSTLEIDVTHRRDGTPVIIHKSLANDDEGILFEEAIKFLAKSSAAKINLDLKAFDEVGKAVDIIEKYNMRDRCFFTGVEESQVQAVRAQARGIEYYLNVKFSPLKKHSRKFLKQTAEKIKSCGAMGINCNFGLASKEMVEIMHGEGLLCSFWTANTEKLMKKMLLLSPDNITTRHPTTLERLAKS